MKYICALLAVRDINASRRFYEGLFGLEVFQDYGRNVQFYGGLALQQDFDWLVGIPKEKVLWGSNNAELAFEEADFDGFLEKLAQYPGVTCLGGVKEHDWGQRVVRFYDPDGHLIEVGEEMMALAQRFLASGMAMDAIAAKFGSSTADVQKLLEK